VKDPQGVGISDVWGLKIGVFEGEVGQRVDLISKHLPRTNKWSMSLVETLNDKETEEHFPSL